MATDYSKMKVTELKAELKRLGLPQNGLKADLVARLETAAVIHESGPKAAPGTESEATAPVVGTGDGVREGSDEQSVEADANVEEAEGKGGEEGRAEAETSPQNAAAIPGTPPSEPTLPVTTTIDTAVDPTHPIATTDFAVPEVQPQASLPPSSSSATPVRPTEIIHDSQKRKRRSASPPPVEADIAQKRARRNNAEPTAVFESSEPDKDVPARQARDAVHAEQADVEMGNTGVGLLTETPVRPHAPEASQLEDSLEMPQDQFENGHQTEVPMHKDDKQQPHTYADAPMDDFPDEVEHDVEPSIHPATSALYIANFMRPLRPQAVQDHLLELTTPAGQDIDHDTIVNFYLDTIRTHSFVVFNSISAASRVRTALHNRVWPDETNRKALWVDFIPPEKFSDWVDMEQSSGGGRGSTNRCEVTYDHDHNGNVTARLDASGAAPPAVKQEPSQADRKLSIPTGPRGFTGIETAPLGPRNSFSGGRQPPLHPARMDRVGGAFTSTRAFPTISYKPVSADLVDRRLAAIRAAKSKSYDQHGDANKEYKRFFFENGDLLVDRGPEIFLGIRPPHRERERRRDQGRDNRRRQGGGRAGGRPGRRGNLSSSMPMPHGVPKGGDRYRGAAAGDDYDRPRYDDERGGDRYRGGDSYGRY
ncbi:hypothetical protein BJ170DRAFT_612992 [Xylariales sp. AK1849]|nr:hypothetical protein BJ170DRAFT_612992 [Xylariales sp. AK1849]